jgi:hypothetical protein
MKKGKNIARFDALLMIFLILTAVISSDGLAFMPPTALACPSGSCSTSTASINDTTFSSSLYGEGIKDTGVEIDMTPSSDDKTIFYDDFHDGNYDGWTVVQGSWSAANCYLGSTCGHCGASIQTPLNISTEKAVFQFYAAFPLLDCRGAGFTLKDSHGEGILSFGPDYCVPWGSPPEVRFWIRDGGYWTWSWPADTGWHFYTLVFERGEYKLFYDGISIINATGPTRIDAATLELGGWQHRNPGTGYDNVMVEWEALVEASASKYAPNLWFDSTEELYPTSPFFDDDDLSGEDNKDDYYALSFDQKMGNFTIYYHTVDAGEEIVYEYWFYYAYNNWINKHYHDWETVYVFVDKSTEEVTRVVASAHGEETPNNVLEDPQFVEGEHAGILIEGGSHASCTDRNNNGLFEREIDITNGYILELGLYPFAWGILDRDQNDVLLEYKITHHSPYYNLREITGDFITKFRGLERFDDPTLGFPVEVPILGGIFYVPIGGEPPKHPWNQTRYKNPYEIIPYMDRFITGTVSGSDTTGAIVVILSEEPYYTFADENGNFMLNNIPYGVYDVVVNLEGYTPYKQRFMHEGNTSLGVNGILYIIPESEAFRIEGITTDAEGNSIPNATINVYDESGTQLFTTLTDENGTYLVMVSERHVYTVEALTGTEVGLAKVSGKAGSVVKADIIVGKISIVEYIDTELQDLIEEVNSMDITKGIKNSLLSKLENARSKNEDALKFIEDGKEKQANNMLNAEDNIMNAFINEVEAQSGKKIAEEDAEHLMVAATDIRALIQLALETSI